MDKNDVETMLHALNTFPKAFFVWGILDQNPQRPVEMEDKLREKFPYLCEFTFLDRKNFAQYCHKSLKGIALKDHTYWGNNAFQKEVSTWSLIDDSIQPIAGFILTKCIENGVNCESFLSSRKNSSSLSNLLSIQIFERLYENERMSVCNLAHYLHLDPTSVDRHLLKVAANNFVAYEAPTTDSKSRKRMIKNTIAAITPKGRVIFEKIIMPIASIMNGKTYNDKIFRETEPKEMDLINALKMYARDLEPNFKFDEK
jgi:DNA-binding MarR family transcriptional regulator